MLSNFFFSYKYVLRGNTEMGDDSSSLVSPPLFFLLSKGGSNIDVGYNNNRYIKKRVSRSFNWVYPVCKCVETNKSTEPYKHMTPEYLISCCCKDWSN